jgi:hypothetical protein
MSDKYLLTVAILVLINFDFEMRIFAYQFEEREFRERTLVSPELFICLESVKIESGALSVRNLVG